MKKTNRVQRAIAAPLPWSKGSYVAEYLPHDLIGHRRNAVLFAEALRIRLMEVRS